MRSLRAPCLMVHPEVTYLACLEVLATMASFLLVALARHPPDENVNLKRPIPSLAERVARSFVVS